MSNDYPTIDSLNAALDSVAEAAQPYDGEDGDWHGYRKLRVWHQSMGLVVAIYRLSDCLPKTETYGLSSQMRRASASIAINIAEGWGRNSRLDFARFIDIAVGSLCELETTLELALMLDLVSRDEIGGLNVQCASVGRMLHKLRTKLRS